MSVSEAFLYKSISYLKSGRTSHFSFFRIDWGTHYFFFYIISDVSLYLYITLSISVDVIFQLIKKFVVLSVISDISIYLELCLITTHLLFGKDCFPKIYFSYEFQQWFPIVYHSSLIYHWETLKIFFIIKRCLLKKKKKERKENLSFPKKYFLRKCKELNQKLEKEGKW